MLSSIESMSSVLFGLEARIVQPTAVNSSRSEAEVLQLLSTAGLSLKETIVVHSSVVRVKLAPSMMAVLRPGLFVVTSGLTVAW